MNKLDFFGFIVDWCSPVYCEMLNFRHLIILFIGVGLTLTTLNPILTMGWFIGFEIFGWGVAVKAGMFERDY